MQSLPASNVKLWRWRALREGCQTTRKPSHTSKNMLQNDVFCQIHRFLKSIKKTLKNSSPFHRPQLFFFFFCKQYEQWQRTKKNPHNKTDITQWWEMDISLLLKATIHGQGQTWSTGRHNRQLLLKQNLRPGPPTACPGDSWPSTGIADSSQWNTSHEKREQELKCPKNSPCNLLLEIVLYPKEHFIRAFNTKLRSFKTGNYETISSFCSFCYQKAHVMVSVGTRALFAKTNE